MRVFCSVFIIRFKSRIQYRSAAIAGMSTQFFWGIMLIMIYTAFYNSAVDKSGLEINQIITYTWLQQAFLAAVALMSFDKEIIELIRTGGVSYELVRPQNIYLVWFSKLLSSRSASMLLRFPLVIIFSSIMPDAFRLTLPDGLLNFTLFIIALLFAVLLVVSYNMITYILVFYLMSADGLIWAFECVAMLLSGQFVPLMLISERFQTAAYLLPFAYMSDFPFRIYSGGFDYGFVLRGILLQIVWLAVFIAAGGALLAGGFKRTSLQGG